MPEIKAVERILHHRERLTDDEWVALIVDRAQHVRYQMDRMTLRKLGTVEFTNSDIKTPVDLNVWRNDLKDEEEALDTQGIFTSRSVDYTKYIIWGLPRNGSWFVCEFARVTGENHRYEIRGFRSEEDVKTFSLHKRYGVPYHLMWRLLYDAVHECAERRREQLRTIENIERQFEHENTLIKALVP